MAIVAEARPAPDWSDGACLDEDPELFFPIGETGVENQEQIEDARAVCLQGGPDGEACPLRAACLEWALATNQLGVWGGTSEKERLKLKRQERQERRELEERHLLEASGLGVAA